MSHCAESAVLSHAVGTGVRHAHNKGIQYSAMYVVVQ